MVRSWVHDRWMNVTMGTYVVLAPNKGSLFYTEHCTTLTKRAMWYFWRARLYMWKVLWRIAKW